MRAYNYRGMTLVEILVAAFIFTLAIGTLLYSLISVLYFIEMARAETIATYDLKNMMELIRTTAFANTVSMFPDSVVNGPINNNYSTAIGGYTLNNEQIVVTYANINADPLEIRVDLTWQDGRGKNHNMWVSTFKTR